MRGVPILGQPRPRGWDQLERPSGAFRAFFDPEWERGNFAPRTPIRERVAWARTHADLEAGAFSTSAMFRQFMSDMLGSSVSFSPSRPALDRTTHKVALYGNSGTPNFDDTAAHNAYNGAGGAWVTANEASTTGGYSAGGTTLLSTTVTNVAGGITQWDADPTGWTTVTVTAYGCLIYADALTSPVADQGIVAVAFGGSFATTAGNFTIQWSANGIYQDDN